MNKANAKVNDLVEFQFKAQRIQGTIIRFRQRERRKMAQLMQTYGVKDPYLSTSVSMAEISVPGKGIYTVSEDSILKVIEADSASASDAQEFASDLKQQIVISKNNKRSANYEIADAHGLIDGIENKTVWVRYKGGAVVSETMAGFTPTWQVKIDNFGRSRFIPPKFVFKTEQDARENKQND